MTSEEIRLELFKIRKKKTMNQIAQDLGVSKSAITRVVNRDFISERIMKAIADAIGRDKKYVWPERFLKASNQ